MEEEKEFQAFTIRLPASMHNILKEIAFYYDLPMNTIIIGTLVRKLEDFIKGGYNLGELKMAGIPIMSDERKNVLIQEAQKLQKEYAEGNPDFWKGYLKKD